MAPGLQVAAQDALLQRMGNALAHVERTVALILALTVVTAGLSGLGRGFSPRDIALLAGGGTALASLAVFIAMLPVLNTALKDILAKTE